MLFIFHKYELCAWEILPYFSSAVSHKPSKHNTFVWHLYNVGPASMFCVCRKRLFSKMAIPRSFWAVVSAVVWISLKSHIVPLGCWKNSIRIFWGKKNKCSSGNTSWKIIWKIVSIIRNTYGCISGIMYILDLEHIEDILCWTSTYKF